jgi:hypothetical protein
MTYSMARVMVMVKQGQMESTLIFCLFSGSALKLTHLKNTGNGLKVFSKARQNNKTPKQIHQKWMNKSINQLINRPSNQATHQSINQSIVPGLNVKVKSLLLFITFLLSIFSAIYATSKRVVHFIHLHFWISFVLAEETICITTTI